MRYISGIYSFVPFETDTSNIQDKSTRSFEDFLEQRIQMMTLSLFYIEFEAYKWKLNMFWNRNDGFLKILVAYRLIDTETCFRGLIKFLGSNC